MELQRILIVGASSGIGEALALHLAGAGKTLGLVARRQAALARVADEVTRRGGKAVVEVSDAADPRAVEASWASLLSQMGGIDAVVYAAGVMPDVAPDEFDTAKDQQVIEINVLGAVAWLNCAARHFAPLGRGVICGIGSVAGDRGRRGAPVYGASKAALHTYLESLRNRLAVRGVRVVTVKPGPVRTPMLGDKRMPLTVNADVAAAAIARSLSGGPEVVYVHWLWRWIMLAIRSVPSLIFRKLSV
jgi:short-subunit dehydrogenase